MDDPENPLDNPDLDLSEADADALVGSVDDDAPVALITAPDEEAVTPPEDGWDADAHAEEYDGDPLTVYDPDATDDAPAEGDEPVEPATEPHDGGDS